MFITEHMELVLEAFRFKPAAFVPKGQLAEELPRALRRILEKGRENPVFVTRKKNRDRIVELNQVVYLKYIYDHEVQFTLKDGSCFSETGSMKQFEAELSPSPLPGHRELLAACQYYRLPLHPDDVQGVHHAVAVDSWQQALT